MDLAADHIGFVLAAYAVSAVVLAAVTASVLLRFRRMARRLGDLKSGGAPRRRRAMEAQL